jgi:hypothetical protein
VHQPINAGAVDFNDDANHAVSSSLRHPALSSRTLLALAGFNLGLALALTA